MAESLYQKKYELFQELAKITEKMAQFTTESLVKEEGTIEEFQSLLQQRETLMNQVDQLGSESSGLDLNQVERARELQTSIQAEALKIQKYNESIEAVAKTALSQLREKTKKVQEGRQSSKAYDGRLPMSEGAFIDKRR